MGRDALQATAHWLGETDFGRAIASGCAASAECRALAAQLLVNDGGIELVEWLKSTPEPRSLAWRLSHERDGRDLARDLLEQHPWLDRAIAGLPLGLAAVVVQAGKSRTDEDLTALCAEFVDG